MKYVFLSLFIFYSCNLLSQVDTIIDQRDEIRRVINDKAEYFLRLEKDGLLDPFERIDLTVEWSNKPGRDDLDSSDRRILDKLKEDINTIHLFEEKVDDNLIEFTKEKESNFEMIYLLCDSLIDSRYQIGKPVLETILKNQNLVKEELCSSLDTNSTSILFNRPFRQIIYNNKSIFFDYLSDPDCNYLNEDIPDESIPLLYHLLEVEVMEDKIINSKIWNGINLKDEIGLSNRNKFISFSKELKNKKMANRSKLELPTKDENISRFIQAESNLIQNEYFQTIKSYVDSILILEKSLVKLLDSIYQDFLSPYMIKYLYTSMILDKVPTDIVLGYIFQNQNIVCQNNDRFGIAGKEFKVDHPEVLMHYPIRQIIIDNKIKFYGYLIRKHILENEISELEIPFYAILFNHVFEEGKI